VSYRSSSNLRNVHPQNGVALVIILVFIVLLTGLVVAFFTRAMSERQISNSSANQTRVDILAQGATNQIIGDLEQEIAAGSMQPFAKPASGVTLYLPKAAASPSPGTMLPALVGSSATGGLANLIKRSAYNTPFYPSGSSYDTSNYPPPNRASKISTAGTKTNETSPVGPSLNGRYISQARWNKPLLIPPTSVTALAPATSANFVAPDWVLVARDGSTPASANYSSSMGWSASNQSAVIGRYAYAIYDEGGLLDANAAGYPSTAVANQYSYKSAQSFADLTQVGLTQKQSDELVAWRNYATAQTPGSTYSNPGFTATSAINYYNSILSNTSGFLKTYNTTLNNSQSDRMFASRQELLDFLQNGIGVPVNNPAFQCLTTFTRELNQPAFAPDSKRPKVLSSTQGGNSASSDNPGGPFDDKINPSYLTVRVQRSFTRNDGSPANVGDPLVNKRFALNRLAWLTCKGPSQPRASTNDADIVALKNDGMSQAWLEQGTDDNIAKYFGLRWNGSQWLYNIHNGHGSGRGSIMRVGRPLSETPDPNTYVEDLAQGRDPDFFELLKSAITVGSLGKSLVNDKLAVTADNGASSASEQPYNYNYDPERSVDRQIIQIGANMINQSRPDNFPVQIVFDDGVGNRNASPTAPTTTTIAGVANLPYLYYIFNGVLQVQAPSVLPRSGKGNNPKYNNAAGTGVDGDSGYQTTDTAALTNSGVGAVMQIPALWNPHDPTGPAAVDGPKDFRVVADSTTPDQLGTSNYSKFFAYSVSGGTTVNGANSNSYNGIGPNSSWYRSASQTGSEIAHAITASNNEIDFTASSGTAQLFPEPTMLLRAATIYDSNGNAVTVKLGGTPLMSTDPAVSALFSGGGLRNFIPDATRFSTFGSSIAPYPTTTPYLGFYLGAFPWAWNYPTGTVPLSGAQSGANLSRVNGSVGGSLNACYLTYRVQCKDAFGNWMTYDIKYGKVSDGNLAPGNIGTTSSKGALLPSYTSGGTEKGFWATVTDPRTSRFGIHWNGILAVTGTNNAVGTGAGGGLEASVNQTGQGGWLDYANGILKTNRPDAQSGFYFMACWRNGGMPTSTSGWMAWSSCNAAAFPGLAPGLLSQNNSDIYYSPSRTYGDGQGGDTGPPNYFADPDGIVRRGMGAFVPIGLASSPSARSGDSRLPSGDTTVGLPIARIFAVNTPSQLNSISPTTTNYTSGSTLSQAQSRPYFLHRPFRSVAELGCVFSDTPWRNLDFFTSESGNAALLDVFCISDTDEPSGLVAGKVNLNTRQQPVLKAVLTGAYLDPANITTGAVMSAPTADKVASALTTYINSNGPIQNLAELVGKWKTNAAISHPAGTLVSKPPPGAPFYDGKLSYIGFSGGQWDSANHQPKLTAPAADVYSAYMNAADFATNSKHNGTRETAAYIQRIREAPIRALSASGQTRVWNLMIDVIAQTGRYPQSAKTLANFMVEGEQRYWVHVAIDRYTGQIIDKQIEVIKE